MTKYYKLSLYVTSELCRRRKYTLFTFKGWPIWILVKLLLLCLVCKSTQYSWFFFSAFHVMLKGFIKVYCTLQHSDKNLTHFLWVPLVAVFWHFNMVCNRSNTSEKWQWTWMVFFPHARLWKICRLLPLFNELCVEMWLKHSKATSLL